MLSATQSSTPLQQTVPWHDPTYQTNAQPLFYLNNTTQKTVTLRTLKLRLLNFEGASESVTLR